MKTNNIKLNDDLADIIYNKAIQITLKKLREKNKLSFQQLANKLDNIVSRQTLCHYETGDSKVRMYMLEKLAKIYNITIEEIFTMITANYFIELGIYLQK